MKDQDPAPFLSHVVRVSDVPRSGLRVTIEADEATRSRIAKAWDLAALPRFTAAFVLSGNARRLKLKGDVRAEVRQTCVVSLEPFDSKIHEQFDLTFSEDVPEEGAAMQHEDDGASLREDPEPIVNDRIDLGVIAAEYLALAIDPWPRKPGVSFAWTEDDEEPSPFAALKRLRDSGDADS